MDGSASNFSGLQGNTNQTTTPNQNTAREQGMFMPISNVVRIMRKVLPHQAKTTDEAKESVQECVSEFIRFITSEANDRCRQEHRRTVTADDVLWAMKTLGMDNYAELLTRFLHKHRTMEGRDPRGSIRGQPPSFNRNSGTLDMNTYGRGVADPYGFRYPAINNQQHGIYDSRNMENYYNAMSAHGGSALPDADGSGGTSGTSNQFDPFAGFH